MRRVICPMKTNSADDLRVFLNNMNPGKRRCIEEYIRYFPVAMSKDSVIFYKGPGLSLPPTNAPLNLDANKVRLQPGNYSFNPNECYINFANREIGGGVFRNGFVQEEFLLCQMDALAFLSHAKQNGCKVTDENTIIIQCNKIYDMDPDLYANSMNYRNGDLIPLEKPIPILFTCLPAIKFPSPVAKYTYMQLMTLLKRCYTAFRDSLNLMKSLQYKKLIINTGMWGCGAYNNDPVTIFKIQMYCTALLQNEYDFEIVYHMSDKQKYTNEFNAEIIKLQNCTFDKYMAITMA